jgi:hypothetical protein
MALYNVYRVFTGEERLQRGAAQPSTSNARVANGLELYLRLPSVPAQTCHGVTFTFKTFYKVTVILNILTKDLRKIP